MTAPSVRPASSTRPLLVGLYLLALALVLPSLMEFLLVSFPYRPGTAQWRFGAVGLLFNSVLFSPIMGLTLALFAAVQLGHRRTGRTLALIAVLVAVFLLVAAPFFVLDFLQLRAMVNPQAKRAFDATSIKAALTGGLMFLAALAVGVGGWRSTSTPTGQRASGRASATPKKGTAVVGASTAEAPQG